MAIDKKREKNKVVFMFVEELWHSWSCDAFRNTIFSTLSSYKSKLKKSHFILKLIKNPSGEGVPPHRGVRSDQAQVTVYQKHRSLQSCKTMYGGHLSKVGLFKMRNTKVILQKNMYIYGNVHVVQKLRQLIKTWYTPSENLKQEINCNFRMTNPLNPCYMDATRKIKLN